MSGTSLPVEIHRRRRSFTGGSGNLEFVNAHPESEASDGLMSTLSVVENQPLEQRAEGYAQLYEALRAQLEGGDLPSGTN